MATLIQTVFHVPLCVTGFPARPTIRAIRRAAMILASCKLSVQQFNLRIPVIIVSCGFTLSCKQAKFSFLFSPTQCSNNLCLLLVAAAICLANPDLMTFHRHVSLSYASFSKHPAERIHQTDFLSSLQPLPLPLNIQIQQFARQLRRKL